MKRKCLLAAVLLISAFSSASAQTNWSYGDNGSAGRRAITARPMMAGRNMAAAVADQYSYGPALLLRPSGVEPVPLALLEALAYLRS
jgi:hypothetical protein